MVTRLCGAQSVMTAALVIGGAMLVGCGSSVDAIEELPPGAEVEITTVEGEVVEGALVGADPNEVVVKTQAGEDRTLPRETIATVERPAGSVVKEWLTPAPDSVDVTVPAATTMEVVLETPLSSKTAAVEDRVRAVTRAPVSIAGREVIPARSVVTGEVIDAEPSGKVKGRGRLAIRFTVIEVRDEGHDIVARPLVYQAEGTKKEDAAKIGIGAAAGAIIGGIAEGGKGAAIGSIVGGGAGTAVVLMTPGEDVSLPSGTRLNVELVQPLEVRVPID